MLTVASRATALCRVRDHNIRTLLRFSDEFETFVLRINGRSGLRWRDREHFDALHVLLDVCSIDIADDRSTRNERRL
jgi:hypothetical protein